MSRRILLADDSVTIQKVIELTFMDEDYEVTAVSNGDEAVARLADADPDFVIADVHMPGANGYEVCRRAKQAKPGVPVLLLVGTFEPFDEARSREAGADRFLKKPFDSQELLHLVEELLGPQSAGGPEPVAEPAAPVFEAPVEEAPPAPFVAEPFEPRLIELPEEEAEPTWGNLDFAAESVPAEPAPFAPAEERTIELPEEGTDVLDLEPLEEDFSPYEGALQPDAFAAVGTPEPAAPEAALPEPLFTGFSAFQTTSEERVSAPQGEAPYAESLEEVWEQVEAREGEPALEAAATWTPAAPAAAAVSAVAVASGPLSDDDVDRIARRLVELVGDKAVRDVAWEVVPDLAEVIIKDRIREIESQAE